jgi:choline dehydrogenase-like flavoprotein
VIGSGAGGGAAAHALAAAGRRVLVLERGRRWSDTEGGRDERRMLLERAAGDDRPLRLNGAPGRLVTGGGVGGSTALYGAALVRPSPEDFRPGRWYGERLPRALWDWPVGLDELAPFYDWAEELFAVAGDAGQAVPHLARRPLPYKAPLPPLAPANARLAARLRAQGLAPFALPLAIDFARCLRCAACPGYVCPNGARASSASAAIDPAVRRGAAVLWEDAEALELLHARGRVTRLRVRRRAAGRIDEVAARAFVLAAGALGSPVLLLRSGLAGRSDQVGRNHMQHLGALAVALFARATGGARGFVKQLALADRYLGAPEFPHKLGLVQCVPIPGPLTLGEHAPVPVPAPLARLVQDHALVFAGSIEDLPRPENRVRLGPGGAVRLDRAFDPYDVARARWLLGELRGWLRRAGALAVPGRVAEHDHAHAAHQVGTCRMGRDPAGSVVAPDGRVHGVENLFVADGSVLPTSLGVGPALTIAANALRVASGLAQELP